MNRVVVSAILMAVLAFSAADAAIYTYYPSPIDLNDLDHYKYYKWGINWTHTSEYITGATLKFTNIYDWIHEDGDSLYVHLLNDPPLGVSEYTDNQGGGDNFAGTPRIGSWSDPFGDYSHRTTLTYDLGALGLLPTLRTYAADGRFGIGVDPDCHYFNDRVELKVYTGIVPEPATLTLLGLGLVGFGAIRRRKK